MLEKNPQTTHSLSLSFQKMGTTVGTLSWDFNKKDDQIIATFKAMAIKQGLEYDSIYGRWDKTHTQFAVDSSGLRRSSKKVQKFMASCKLMLEVQDVSGIIVEIEELPM